MKARIINDVEDVQNLIDFEGETYDIQHGMWSEMRIHEKWGGLSKALEIGATKGDLVLELFTILLNEAVIIKNRREKKDIEQYSDDYIKAVVRTVPQLQEITAVTFAALGLKVAPKPEDTTEPQEIIDEQLEALEEFEKEKN